MWDPQFLEHFSDFGGDFRSCLRSFGYVGIWILILFQGMNWILSIEELKTPKFTVSIILPAATETR